MARDCAFPVLRDIFIRHSAVLSLTAVLLRKVPVNVVSKRTATKYVQRFTTRMYSHSVCSLNLLLGGSVVFLVIVVVVCFKLANDKFVTKCQRNFSCLLSYMYSLILQCGIVFHTFCFIIDTGDLKVKVTLIKPIGSSF